MGIRAIISEIEENIAKQCGNLLAIILRNLRKDSMQGFPWAHNSCSFDTIGTTLLVMFLQLSKEDQDELLQYDDSGLFTLFHCLLVTHYFPSHRTYKEIMMFMTNFCRNVLDFKGEDEGIDLSTAFERLFNKRNPQFVRPGRGEGREIRAEKAMKQRCYIKGYYMDHLLLSTFTCPKCERDCVNGVRGKACLDITQHDVETCRSIQMFLQDEPVRLQLQNLSPLLFITVPSLTTLNLDLALAQREKNRIVAEIKSDQRKQKTTKDVDQKAIYEKKIGELNSENKQIDESIRNLKNLKQKRNTFVVQKRLTILTNKETKRYELAGVALYIEQQNHFVSYLNHFGKWMFYDGMENDGNFAPCHHPLASLNSTEAVKLQDLDPADTTRELASVAGLFWQTKV